MTTWQTDLLDYTCSKCGEDFIHKSVVEIGINETYQCPHCDTFLILDWECEDGRYFGTTKIQPKEDIYRWKIPVFDEACILTEIKSDNYL